MIVISAIQNEIGEFVPSQPKPANYKAELFDGTNFTYYQTDEDYQIYESIVNAGVNTTTAEEIKLNSDIEFGKNLINEFLLDNRLAPQSFTPQDSLGLLQKLQAIQALSSLGDIKSVAILMPLVEIDTIFTQERKDKYVAMITNYLAQWV